MIGIISDTHENIAAINRAIRRFSEFDLDFLVHCGDIISPPVLRVFEGFALRVVFGNNDGEREGLQTVANELGFGEITDELIFQHLGKSFYVYHGTRSKTLNDAIATQKYDYVLTGHTHRQRNELIGKTKVINPGALFSAPLYSVALLDPTNDWVEFLEI